jgi:hypothetical protein
VSHAPLTNPALPFSQTFIRPPPYTPPPTPPSTYATFCCPRAHCRVYLQVPHTAAAQIPAQETSGRRSFQNRLLNDNVVRFPYQTCIAPLARLSFTFQSGSPAPTSNSHPLLLAPHCSVFLHLPNTPTPRSPTPPSSQYCSVLLQAPHTMAVQIPSQEISGRRSFQNRLGCSSM